MTPERYQQIRSVFHEVHTLEPDRRETRLRELCSGDAELEAEVVKLIVRASDATGFLDKPAISNSPLQAIAAQQDVPDKIGPYKIVEKLGGGGMGDVYLAEQSHPIKRRVALKVIREGMDSRGVVARFELERQALALMDHPNIAKVFDAGTDKARPYFVMEYVPGMHLTEYCDRHRLHLEDRLRLFHDVCDAVQHAHSKGIIHRDLKPSNILVMRREGESPLVKIIDFGVAKATETSVASDFSIHTMSGTPIGTWDYMSPEQAAGKVGRIDIRSDVYSMGVILYELLTGMTPIDLEESAHSSMMDVQQSIVKSEAPRPSTRLRDLGKRLEFIADLRRTSGHGLTRVLRRDLDWVVMKAIEKDAGRRYQTARELGDEIQRFLDNEPVLAGPPTALYRAQKFVRRNRGLVIGSGAVLLVMLAGTVTSWVLYMRSQDALERMTLAERRAASSAQDAQRNAEQAQANALQAQRNFEEAEEQRRQQQAARQDADAQKELAQARARELADRSASMAETIGVLLSYLNSILDAGGNLDREQLLSRMREVVAQVIHERPNEIQPQITRIRLSEVERDFAAMAAQAQEALSDPLWEQNAYDLWFYLGVARLNSGAPDRAALALARSDRILSDRADSMPRTSIEHTVVAAIDEVSTFRSYVLMYLGEAYRCMGDLERARELLSDAREMQRSTSRVQLSGQEDTAILANLAFVEYQRGVPSSAAGWFRRALRINPDTPDAKQFLVHSLHASALRALADHREQRAADELDEACQEAYDTLPRDDPRLSELEALRGQTLATLRKDDQAERSLLRAWHAIPPERRLSDPTGVSIMASLAEIYRRQNRLTDLALLERSCTPPAAAFR